MKIIILALLLFCSCFNNREYKWTLKDNTNGKVYELDKGPMLSHGVARVRINGEIHYFNGNYEIIAKPIN